MTTCEQRVRKVSANGIFYELIHEPGHCVRVYLKYEKLFEMLRKFELELIEFQVTFHFPE